MKKIFRSTPFIGFVLALILGFIFYFIGPLFNSIKFGLDLKGGFEVLYQVKTVDGSKLKPEELTSTYKTISKRIDVLGVSEPEIITEGEDKIRVKLAGITNQDEARKILSMAASLTFRDTNNNLLMTSDVLTSGGAKVGQDNLNRPAVALSVKDTEKFYDVTNKVRNMEDNRIVIWLDYDELTDSFAKDGDKCGTEGSNCLSVASVSEAFASDVIIQGNFTKAEVQELVDLINSGSISTKLSEISSKTVSASFGIASLNQTVTAGLIGVAIIILILVAIYHFSGLIAAITMLIYGFLTFLVFKLLDGVLTLPGIAAMVLGLGMAVDANVISFERIKEELLMGKTLPAAFKAGNERSLGTILDANITTFIVALFLFIFGESSVKGFATMLIVSILVTMFVMVVVTKYILKLFINTKLFDKRLKLFINVDKKNVQDIKKAKMPEPFKKLDFVKNSKAFFIGSIVLLVAGFVAFVTTGFNLGIDYKGGSDINILATKTLVAKDLRADIKELDYNLVEITMADENNAFIKLDNVLTNTEIKTINTYFNDKYDAKTEIGVVSNMVKKELIKNAILSIILSMIGIIIYVSLRFKFSYALSGIIALFHDAFAVIAFFSIFKLQIDSLFIAAILTIIGYSINDTIVTFDRIRETINNMNFKKIPSKEVLSEVVNRALRETLFRNILSSVTVIIPVITLIIFGTKDINAFNIAMLVGLIAGAYSSIFIASQLWLVLESRHSGKEHYKQRFVSTDKVDELKVKGINA